MKKRALFSIFKGVDNDKNRIMSTLEKINSKNTKTEFDKKVLSAIQHLHPYVKHRLYIAESTGIIPRKMYTSGGIIDDGIVKLYENGFDIDADSMDVKLRLFRFVDQELDDLFKKESFHKNTVSTNSILEEEMDKLSEDYTIDADLDLVLKTELNDISYQQDNSEHVFVYDDNESSVLNAFEVEDISSMKSKNLLGSFYGTLPVFATDIIDLYAFGKLNFDEIARVKKMETRRVERVFDAIKKSFRKHIG